LSTVLPTIITYRPNRRVLKLFRLLPFPWKFAWVLDLKKSWPQGHYHYQKPYESYHGLLKIRMLMGTPMLEPRHIPSIFNGDCLLFYSLLPELFTYYAAQPVTQEKLTP